MDGNVIGGHEQGPSNYVSIGVVDDESFSVSTLLQWDGLGDRVDHIPSHQI